MFFPPTTKTTLKQSTGFCAPRHCSKLHHCSDIGCRHAVSPRSGGLFLNATKITLCFESKGWFRPECLCPSLPRAQSLLGLQPHLVTPCVLGSVRAAWQPSTGPTAQKTSSASFTNWDSGCSFTDLQPVFLTLFTAQIIGVTFHFSFRWKKTLRQKVLSSSPCLQPWVERTIMFRGSEAHTFSRLVKSNLPLLYHPADNETRWKKRPNVFPGNSCC